MPRRRRVESCVGVLLMEPICSLKALRAPLHRIRRRISNTQPQRPGCIGRCGCVANPPHKKNYGRRTRLRPQLFLNSLVETSHPGSESAKLRCLSPSRQQLSLGRRRCFANPLCGWSRHPADGRTPNCPAQSPCSSHSLQRPPLPDRRRCFVNPLYGWSRLPADGRMPNCRASCCCCLHSRIFSIFSFSSPSCRCRDRWCRYHQTRSTPLDGMLIARGRRRGHLCRRRALLLRTMLTRGSMPSRERLCRICLVSSFPFPPFALFPACP
jgi:hypothetical protein